MWPVLRISVTIIVNLCPKKDPISLINSVEWRHGNPEFTDSNFPGEDNIFLQFQSGKMTLYKNQ